MQAHEGLAEVGVSVRLDFLPFIDVAGGPDGAAGCGGGSSSADDPSFGSGGSPADPPLSELGHRQARAVADYLSMEHIDAIYVSTMARAIQTAAPLEAATGLSARQRQGIAEFDRYSTGYIPTEELKRLDYDRWKALMTQPHESDMDPVEFHTEVVETVDGIASEHRGERVAVVCHGGVINAYTADVLGRPRGDFFFCNVDYTSISRVMVASTGERSIHTINVAGHIRHLPHPRHG